MAGRGGVPGAASGLAADARLAVGDRRGAVESDCGGAGHPLATGPPSLSQDPYSGGSWSSPEEHDGFYSDLRSGVRLVNLGRLWGSGRGYPSDGEATRASGEKGKEAASNIVKAQSVLYRSNCNTSVSGEARNREGRLPAQTLILISSKSAAGASTGVDLV